MPSCCYYLQLAPKPIQTQASSGAQQPRLIVPALPSSIPQITGTGATANLQFPHGVISGGVVYLPQVSEAGLNEKMKKTSSMLEIIYMYMFWELCAIFNLTGVEFYFLSCSKL